ncbi:MAG TPA: hypothetical protein VMF06_24750 [Candidatus Limnocylindria bacterium]|jgi:hypothetical protein|nr:hypothetical protein [Candidatus Limnocylindria bacterium]
MKIESVLPFIVILFAGCRATMTDIAADKRCQALVNAAIDNDVTEAANIISSGVDVDCRAKTGTLFTPLLWAVYYRNSEMAYYLVEQGASLTAEDSAGHDVEDYAISGGEPLEKLVDMCRAEKEKKTPTKGIK